MGIHVSLSLFVKDWKNKDSAQDVLHSHKDPAFLNWGTKTNHLGLPK